MGALYILVPGKKLKVSPPFHQTVRKRSDARLQIAQLADGFVVARQGGTVVMVSAVSNRKEMDESGFLPLAVEYREKVRCAPCGR